VQEELLLEDNEPTFYLEPATFQAKEETLA
jgi:hypothetical protein